MVVYAKVISPVATPSENLRREADNGVIVREFVRREFEQLVSDRRLGDYVIVCDDIGVDRVDSDGFLTVNAKVGSVMKHFHFRNVTHLEVDEQE